MSVVVNFGSIVPVSFSVFFVLHTAAPAATAMSTTSAGSSSRPRRDASGIRPSAAKNTATIEKRVVSTRTIKKSKKDVAHRYQRANAIGSEDDFQYAELVRLQHP